MIEKLHQSIDRLSGSEARNLLVNMMIKIKNMQESKELQEEIMEELYSLYDDILGVSQNKKRVEREYKALHITCGESIAGSLRYGLGRGNKVIGFPDFFAVGPIWELDKEVGRKCRYEWLRDHLNYPDHFIEEEYESRFSKALKEIDTIPEQIPIVIWTAENANEQTGIRYIIYLLKEKANDVFFINSTIAYQELFNTSEFQYFYFHTGEMEPEKLDIIYQNKLTKPLTSEEGTQLKNEWIDLSTTKGVVRIWENNKIKTVQEDYFDELIVSTARKLHAKQKEKDFMKSGRLIGDVLGHMENNVGDAFLEYRLRSLINNGVFEIKGIPKGMRYYSVKLK